jgi:hypothetical protein
MHMKEFIPLKEAPRPVSIIKIDLAKAYDRVSWLFLRLLLLHIGFELVW